MKVALAGLGRMGVRHAEVVEALGLDLVAVSDRRETAYREACDAQPSVAKARFYGDPIAMFEAEKPDVAIISTTAASHADMTCRAAETGARFILCEKPMATSLADAERMIAVCAQHGAALAINHQMRFMEQYTRLKSLLVSEDYGGFSSATVIAGNFGLAMNGTHYFEAFRYLTDESARRVSAHFSAGDVANPRGPEFLDKAGTVRVETASGKRLYIDASSDQGHGIAVVYSSPCARLFVDELTGAITIARREPAHRGMPTTRYGMPWIDEQLKIAPTSVIEPTRRVLKALIYGHDYPSGADGLAAIKVLVAAYQSAENGGRSVDLAEAQLDRKRIFPWA